MSGGQRRERLEAMCWINLYNSEEDPVSVSGEPQKRKRIALTIFGDYPRNPEGNDDVCVLMFFGRHNLQAGMIDTKLD